MADEIRVASAPAAGRPPDRVVTEPVSSAASPIFSKLPSSNEKFHHLIVRFVARLKDQLQTVERAREQGRPEEVAAFAHWLKGTGGTVGFDEFTAPAAKLEKFAKDGGSEADIQQAMAELRGLTARLAVPGADSPGGSLPDGGPPREPSADSALPAAPALPATAKPVTSRLWVQAPVSESHSAVYREAQRRTGESAIGLRKRKYGRTRPDRALAEGRRRDGGLRRIYGACRTA